MNSRPNLERPSAKVPKLEYSSQKRTTSTKPHSLRKLLIHSPTEPNNLRNLGIHSPTEPHKLRGLVIHIHTTPRSLRKPVIHSQADRSSCMRCQTWHSAWGRRHALVLIGKHGNKRDNSIRDNKSKDSNWSRSRSSKASANNNRFAHPEHLRKLMTRIPTQPLSPREIVIHCPTHPLSTREHVVCSPTQPLSLRKLLIHNPTQPPNLRKLLIHSPTQIHNNKATMTLWDKCEMTLRSKIVPRTTRKTRQMTGTTIRARDRKTKQMTRTVIRALGNRERAPLICR